MTATSQRALRARKPASCLALAIILALSSAVQARQDGSPAAADLRARGLDLGYNLDHAAALRAFDDAIAADPADPRNYCLAAGAAWISLVFAQGAITVDDYLGQTQGKGARPKPDPALDAAYDRHDRTEPEAPPKSTPEARKKRSGNRPSSSVRE